MKEITDEQMESMQDKAIKYAEGTFRTETIEGVKDILSGMMVCFFEQEFCFTGEVGGKGGGLVYPEPDEILEKIKKLVQDDEENRATLNEALNEDNNIEGGI